MTRINDLSDEEFAAQNNKITVEGKEIEFVDAYKTEVNLNYKILELLRNEPFFGRVSAKLRKRATYSFPTCGIILNPKNQNYELIYNPKFFALLTPAQQLGVIKHEFYHVTLGHLTSRKYELHSGGMAKIKSNVCMDLAINSLPDMGHENLPDLCVFPGEKNFAHLEKQQATEYYIVNIKEEDLKNMAEFDFHGWGTGGQGDTLREIANQKLSDIINQAINECDIQGGNSWGNISQEMQKFIRSTWRPALDPQAFFNYFVKSSVRSEKIHRTTKVNRRWPYMHPGRAWNRRANIAISIDQSGSVSDEMLAKFFSWLNELASFASFTVIPFDDSVFEEKVYVWEKDQKRPWERVLCGGTNFNAPTEYVNKLGKFDGHVIVTDLCAPFPGPSSCQRLWVTVKSCLGNVQNVTLNNEQLKVDTSVSSFNGERVLCVDGKDSLI